MTVEIKCSAFKTFVLLEDGEQGVDRDGNSVWQVLVSTNGVRLPGSTIYSFVLIAGSISSWNASGG